MKSFFTPKEVSKLVGISYRQIQYWDKTGFIKPSYRRRGKYRLYTFSDLVQLKVAKTLRDSGRYSIQTLRVMIKDLRALLPQVSFPFADLKLLVEGKRMLVFSGDVLMGGDTRNHILFDAGALRKDIEKLYPEPKPEGSCVG